MEQLMIEDVFFEHSPLPTPWRMQEEDSAVFYYHSTASSSSSCSIHRDENKSHAEEKQKGEMNVSDWSLTMPLGCSRYYPGYQAYVLDSKTKKPWRVRLETVLRNGKWSCTVLDKPRTKISVFEVDILESDAFDFWSAVDQAGWMDQTLLLTYGTASSILGYVGWLGTLAKDAPRKMALDSFH